MTTSNEAGGLQLKGKVCIIAGASGAIGTAVARAFGERGADLALTYNSSAAQVPQTSGPGRLISLPLEVTERRSVDRLVDTVRRQLGAVDVLVNCVGVLGPVGPVHTLSAEQWIDTIGINLIGAFQLMHAVIPVMLAQGGGKIINFSGGGAAYARPNFSAYAASKAALVRLTETLAAELADHNIQINAVAPGPVKSRMWEQLRPAASAAGQRAREELKQMDETGGVPPARAAELAVFLASDRSLNLSGRLISCIYDRWEGMDSRIGEIMSTDAGTLRRIPLE